MKTSIKPERVQSWILVGMKPMHRALLRGTAEQSARPLTNNDSSQLQLDWNMIDSVSTMHVNDLNSEDSMSQSLLNCLKRSGIMIMGSEDLINRIENAPTEDPVIKMLYQRSKIQIRLLWNWSNRGGEDLLWCTELSFDGVICDLASLNRWVRVCLTKGRVSYEQTNPLLRELQLPNISDQTSPPFSHLEHQCRQS